jgi:hypothetical protein
MGIGQMSETKISNILAQLLVLLGEIRPPEYPKLLEAASESGIPLGRLLVMCQRLTEDELQSALSAAQLVMNGETSINRAAVVLAYGYFWHVPFLTVWERTDFKKSDTVALLLIASGLLHTTKVVELGKKMADGHMVGGLELYRDGLITLEQWRSTLGMALQVKERELNLRQLLYEPEDTTSTADLPVLATSEEPRERLGQLLLQSGLAAEEEVLCALEHSLESGEPLGEILLLRQIITAFELTAALKLQSLIHKKTLSSAQAITWLRRVPQSPELHRVLGYAA